VALRKLRGAILRAPDAVPHVFVRALRTLRQLGIAAHLCRARPRRDGESRAPPRAPRVALRTLPPQVFFSKTAAPRKPLGSTCTQQVDCLRRSKFVGLREGKDRRPWSRNTETKPNRYRLHSWWWFRAQTSALQQATPFLGATNRGAIAIPAMAISRNTSTLNGTFTGDRCFTSSFVSSEARRRKILRAPAKANSPTVPPRQYFRHGTHCVLANWLHGGTSPVNCVFTS
jgi:hypothetical protein